MDMQEINFVKEPLLMDGDVSGLSIYPDLRIDDIESNDLDFFYGIWAITPRQTHSCNVKVVRYYDRIIKDTDAVVTFERNVPIGVKTADCVPILVYAPDVQGIAAIHAGWKGTLGGIVDNTLDVLVEKGADMSLLKVAFGPSISKEVYEVDADLAQKFSEAGFGDFVSFPAGIDEKPHIDLQGVNMERFLRRGVKMENIKLHNGCSVSSKREGGAPLYASHRRSGGAPTRMLTCIMLLSESEMEHYRNLFRIADKE